jgi:GNAT superfamily N-acetyltransferase
MTDRNVLVETAQDPSPEDVRTVVQNLVDFNSSRAEPSNHRALAIFLREGANIVGGASGYTHWRWLFVSHLWVAEHLRGGGWGRELMERIEAAAIERGCGASHLDTFSFQALSFYERLGYRRFGTLPDYPPGEARYFLWKPLGGSP